MKKTRSKKSRDTVPLRGKEMGGRETVWAYFTVNTLRISIILGPIILREINQCQMSSLCLKGLCLQINIFLRFTIKNRYVLYLR
jgi:hypothetical protein